MAANKGLPLICHLLLFVSTCTDFHALSSPQRPQAARVFVDSREDHAKRVTEEIIKANPERITRALGEEKGPVYLGRFVKSVMMHCETGKRYAGDCKPKGRIEDCTNQS